MGIFSWRTRHIASWEGGSTGLEGQVWALPPVVRGKRRRRDGAGPLAKGKKGCLKGKTQKNPPGGCWYSTPMIGLANKARKTKGIEHPRGNHMKNTWGGDGLSLRQKRKS